VASILVNTMGVVAVDAFAGTASGLVKTAIITTGALN
jgi:hypothetical protein